MKMRTVLAGLTLCGIAASACADNGDEGTSVGQAAVDVIDETSDTSCSINERTIRTAVDAYFAINGSDASTLADLGDLLADDLSDQWMLQPAADGAAAGPEVVAVPNGPCDL